MERKHIITISGKPGSGKSSTADKVAELLSYTRYSAGDLVRKILKQQHITLEEFNERATDDHAMDREIDEQLRKLRDEKNVVIDSRLGFYWIPESFKVYLDLDDDVAAARIFKDTVANSSRSMEVGEGQSIGDVNALVQRRLENEKRRFMSMYGANPYDTKNFDLIINTSRHSPQTVALTVFDTYQKWLKSETWTQIVSEVPVGYSFKNQY